MDRGGRPQPRRVGDGLAPLRAATTRAASTRSPARSRSTPPTTTSSIRARSGRPAGRCGSRRPTRGSRSSAPPSGRSPAGSGRTGSSRTRRAATRACARAAGRAQIWSPAIGAEHRACREAAALFDETSFAKIEVLGAGAADFLERLCDNRVARDVGADHVHADAQRARRHRVRLHGHPARGGPLPHRHRNGLRPARPRVDPPASAGRRLASTWRT